MGDGEATLTWTPPTVDGGEPIEKYQYGYEEDGSITLDPMWMDVTGGAAARTVTITGLANDRYYYLYVRAVNSVGPGLGRIRTPANGAPSVTGTGGSTDVGVTLTASTSGIHDGDGVPTTPSSFTYQWFRVDADGVSNRMPIPAAMSSTYTTTIADAGKRVLVEVSFDDLSRNPEGPLASDPYPDTGTLQRQMGSSEPVLVQNTEQTATTNPIRFHLSQAFTTGSNPRGYTLGSVLVDFLLESTEQESTNTSEFRLRIFTTSGTDHQPHMPLYTLTAPETIRAFTFEQYGRRRTQPSFPTPPMPWWYPTQQEPAAPPQGG